MKYERIEVFQSGWHRRAMRKREDSAVWREHRDPTSLEVDLGLARGCSACVVWWQCSKSRAQLRVMATAFGVVLDKQSWGL